jgi:hypothetical protein
MLSLSGVGQPCVGQLRKARSVNSGLGLRSTVIIPHDLLGSTLQGPIVTHFVHKYNHDFGFSPWKPPPVQTSPLAFNSPSHQLRISGNCGGRSPCRPNGSNLSISSKCSWECLPLQTVVTDARGSGLLMRTHTTRMMSVCVIIPEQGETPLLSLRFFQCMVVTDSRQGATET